MNIIVGRHGKSTVRNIVSAMQLQTSTYQCFYKKNGTTFFRCNDNRLPRRYVPQLHGATIRWASCVLPDTDSNCIVYNKLSAISRSSNKRITRQVLKSNGIPIPETVYRNNLNENFLPCIARPDHHYAGKDFYYCTTVQELQNAINHNCTYFSKPYPKTKEYRIHVAHGKILAIQEKTGNDNFKSQHIWNHALSGFIFEVVPWKEYRVSLIRPAVDAVQCLGLDFGAVDVLSNPTDASLPRHVVCEVNTSPSLADYLTTRYAKYFDWLLRSDTRREWYNYAEWSSGKSYSFKNIQLER